MSGKKLMYETLLNKQKEQIPVTPHWWGLYKFQLGKLISGYSEEAKAWVFFANTFWRKMQNIFGECCISKLEKVAKP